MRLPSFKDWMAQQESSAFTRRRHDALLGLAPEITDAEIHSRSTFPFEKEMKDKKRKKKKRDKKEEDLSEGSKQKPVVDRKVDSWLKEIEGLRPDLETLKSVIDKKRTNKKPEKGENKNDVKDDNEPNKPVEPEKRKSDGSDSSKGKNVDDTGRTEPEDS